MTASGVQSAFVDTNIWVQTFPRYLCINLHKVGACHIWYSDLVMDEFLRNVQKLGKSGISEAEAHKRAAEIRKELPHSEMLVRSQATRIANVVLPDECDRHVLYAASAARADVLVTEDLGDFPPDLLKSRSNRFLKLPDHFRVVRLDEFLCDIFEHNTDGFMDALALTLAPMEQGTISEHLTTLRTGHNCPTVSRQLLRSITDIEEAVQQHR